MVEKSRDNDREGLDIDAAIEGDLDLDLDIECDDEEKRSVSRQTFRQRWFPTIKDSEKEDRVSRGGYSISGGVFPFVARWTRTLLLAGLLGLVGYNCIGNNIEYSHGQRVGVVNKISERGLIWTTKEGQLSLEGRTSTGDYIGAGVWDFSIDRLAKHGEDVDGLYSKIVQCMDDGRRVKITYVQPLATWRWRADTHYLVQSVEPLETKARE